MPDRKDQNAIELLKTDHREVEKLFEKFADADDENEKMAIAERICLALKVHTEIEEELFYPACRGKVDDKLVDEALVEHQGAKTLVSEIEAMGEVDDMYEAKVQVLCEQVTHHIKEEETELFPKAQKAGVDMEALGPELAARKQTLTEELGSDLSDEPIGGTRDRERSDQGEARH